jgi:cytochrome c
MKWCLPCSFLLLFIVLFLLVSGCTDTPQPVVPTDQGPTITSSPVLPVTTLQPVSREELVAFVRRAASYAKTEGKSKALAEFDQKNGSFFEDQFYIYAYDFNGTTIAHPVNPEKIGVNRLNEKDAEGNLFITDLRQAAYNGTGFTTYTYINPVHNNTVEKKLGYVMKVDDSWWLGSGIYIGPAQTSAPVTTMQPAQ